MKKLFMLIPLLFIMLACSKPGDNMRLDYRRYCSTPEQQECFGKHFIDCAEAANPKSDEEPEDWLPHCKKASREACCPFIKGVKYLQNHSSYWVPWSMVPDKHKAIINNKGK